MAKEVMSHPGSVVLQSLHDFLGAIATCSDATECNFVTWDKKDFACSTTDAAINSHVVAARVTSDVSSCSGEAGR